MEGITERQRQILAIAKETGRVDVDHLSTHFSVSPQTIRKDLNDLCDRQLLQRIHGGAIVGSGIENVSYEGFDNLIPLVIDKADKITEKPHTLFSKK